jgi:monoamine oxidase
VRSASPKGYDSADASRVSAKALYEEWNKEQETQYRIDKGYSALMDFLAARCIEAGSRILFSHPVTSISIKESGTVVEAGGETFDADKLIIALPLGVLQADTVHISTAPPHYVDALNSLGFGDVIKFVFRFRETFWEESYPDLGFLFSGATIPTWWTQAPSKNAVLTGWMSGRSAHASMNVPEAQLLETAMQSLAQLFSREQEELEAMLLEAHVANWSADPYTLGAYAYATVGSEAARAVLSQPIENRIFFAANTCTTVLQWAPWRPHFGVEEK